MEKLACPVVGLVFGDLDAAAQPVVEVWQEQCIPTTGSNVEIALNWTLSLNELAKIIDGYAADNYLSEIETMIDPRMARANSRGRENTKVTL